MIRLLPVAALLLAILGCVQGEIPLASLNVRAPADPPITELAPQETSATSTLTVVWTPTGQSATSTRNLFFPPPDLVIQAGPGCLIGISYDTGAVSQHGTCVLEDVALAFWSGINRYNPQRIGYEYRSQLTAAGQISNQTRQLERQRDEVLAQLALLTSPGYRIEILDRAQLQAELARLENRRAELMQQVSLLTDALRVLKADLDGLARSQPAGQ
jgi:hypothetical protein